MKSMFKAGSAGRWWLTLAAKYLLVVLILILAGLVVSRVSFRRAEKLYELRLEEYKAQVQVEAEEARAAANMPLTVQEQRKKDAEALARVLYGVKDNSTDDLKTLCWCVINRADNPLYPETVEDVINQPEQWMGFSPENPVLENLYEIAYEELDRWQSGEHRPCSNEYVYMSWTASEIVLRNEFSTSQSTRYWRSRQ